jgi:hypothetical protein
MIYREVAREGIRKKKAAPLPEGLQVILPNRSNTPASVALAERSLQEHP